MRIIEKILVILVGVVIFSSFLVWFLPNLNKVFEMNSELNQQNNVLDNINTIDSSIRSFSKNTENSTFEMEVYQNLRLNIYGEEIEYIYKIKQFYKIIYNYDSSLENNSILLFGDERYEFSLKYINNKIRIEYIIV